jgi:3-oxoacyl-[acyl-carrier protein] reductase
MSEKVVLITGASRGLGAFLASRFWNAGFNLCLVARNADALEKVVDSFPTVNGQSITYFSCDLNDFDATSDLISKVKVSFSRLDVLINNAAIHGPVGATWENKLSEWEDVMRVNLLAPALLSSNFAPWMNSTGGGSIINISGGGATGPRPNFGAYGASKSALVRFSESFAIEAKSLNVRVNCVAPGAMKTALLAEVLEKGAEIAGESEYSVARKVFEEGGASMDKVADLALFLASDASKGITGKLISAVWDDWEHWPEHLNELAASDVYTLRRIAGRDRGFTWGDK